MVFYNDKVYQVSFFYLFGTKLNWDSRLPVYYIVIQAVVKKCFNPATKSSHLFEDYLLRAPAVDPSFKTIGCLFSHITQYKPQN